MEKLFRIGRALFVTSWFSLCTVVFVVFKFDETPVEGTALMNVFYGVPLYIMLLTFIGGMSVMLLALIQKIRLTKHHA